MQRTESVRKVNIREQVDELLSEFEENLHLALQDTGVEIMEEIENNYQNLSLNTEALSTLLSQIHGLLKRLPGELLLHSDGTKREDGIESNKKFKEFIETKHIAVNSAILYLDHLELVVTGGSKGHVFLWDAITFKVIAQHTFDAPIRTFVFDPVQKRLIIAFKKSENNLRSFEVSGQGLDLSTEKTFEFEGKVLTMLLIEQKRRLVVADASWRIQILDLDTLKYIQDLKIEGDSWFRRGNGIEYLPDLDLLVVPGADKPFPVNVKGKVAVDTSLSTLRLFSLENGEMVKEIELKFKNVEQMISVGKSLVLMDSDSLICFDSTNFQEENRIEFEHNHLLDIAYSKKSDLIICTTESPVVILVKFDEKKVIRKLHPKVSRCEREVLCLHEGALVTFCMNESEFIHFGVLDL